MNNPQFKGLLFSAQEQEKIIESLAQDNPFMLLTGLTSEERTHMFNAWQSISDLAQKQEFLKNAQRWNQIKIQMHRTGELAAHNEELAELNIKLSKLEL